MKKLFTLTKMYAFGLVAILSLASLDGKAQLLKVIEEAPLINDMSVQVLLTEVDVEVQLKGPADRWFAIGFGANNMAAGTDVLFFATVNGNTEVYDGRLVGNAAPVVDELQNWELLGNEVVDGIRTITVSRELSTGDVNDYDFDFDATTLQVIYAHGSSASTNLAFHGGNRGAQLLSFDFVSSTSATPQLEEQLLLYPNPASSELNLRVDGAVQIETLHIFDTQARLLKSINGNATGELINIPVGELPAGIYYLEANTRNARAVKRFVIE